MDGVIFIQAPHCEGRVATCIPDHLHVFHPVTLLRLLYVIGFRSGGFKVKGDYMVVWAFKE